VKADAQHEILCAPNQVIPRLMRSKPGVRVRFAVFAFRGATTGVATCLARRECWDAGHPATARAIVQGCIKTDFCG
jgi:hypothetical protein